MKHRVHNSDNNDTNEINGNNANQSVAQDCQSKQIFEQLHAFFRLHRKTDSFDLIIPDLSNEN